MSTFTVPQESIAGLPTIEFRFDGGIARAELAGAKLLAALVSDDRANLGITDVNGADLVDVIVLKVPNDSTITETVCRIGSALLWSHARWVAVQAGHAYQVEPAVTPAGTP